MNKIKLISLDLDGTTLRSDNTLSAPVKTAIEKAIAEGIEVVVASGRPYGSMHKDVLAIKGIKYIIASNGAAIYDGKKIRIHSELLKESDVERFLSLTEPYDLIFEGFVNGLTYTDKRYTDNPIKYGCSAAYVDYVQAAHGKIENMRGFLYENKARLDSIECIITDKSERIAFWQLVEDNIKGFHVTSSSTNFVEFMDSGATKANALKWVCAREGIPLENTCACGNADNDKNMIAASGLGAAVANASQSCIKHANLIVPSNDDDGVAELVEQILNN